MHHPVTNVLRTLVHTNPPQNMTQARDIIDDALATAMHAMQIPIATTLGSTPGVKGLLNASTYAKFCLIVEPFHIPL